MTDTRFFKEIESFVRDKLAERFGQPFPKQVLVVGKRSEGTGGAAHAAAGILGTT